MRLRNESATFCGDLKGLVKYYSLFELSFVVNMHIITIIITIIILFSCFILILRRASCIFLHFFISLKLFI